MILQKKICQTPEEFILETLQDRVDHASAYTETEYLAQSEKNKERLDIALKEIHLGRYKAHGLFTI